MRTQQTQRFIEANTPKTYSTSVVALDNFPTRPLRDHTSPASIYGEAMFALKKRSYLQLIETKPNSTALLEMIRMPNPFHMGLVLTYYESNLDSKPRSIWINGWFGLSYPISIQATVTSHSPYFLPFLPSGGPYIISKESAEHIEQMAYAIENYLSKNQRPYSFVPGVFDGVWPFFDKGGYTSNNVVATLLAISNVVETLSEQFGAVPPWFLAPGADPKIARNIMPVEWFDA